MLETANNSILVRCNNDDALTRSLSSEKAGRKRISTQIYISNEFETGTANRSSSSVIPKKEIFQKFSCQLHLTPLHLLTR